MSNYEWQSIETPQSEFIEEEVQVPNTLSPGRLIETPSSTEGAQITPQAQSSELSNRACENVRLSSFLSHSIEMEKLG